VIQPVSGLPAVGEK